MTPTPRAGGCDHEENDMRTRLAALAATAAIGIGGLVVAAFNPMGMASAQDAPAAGPATGRHGPLVRALDALVADGTITEAQAAAVTERVGDEATDGRPAGKERRAATIEVVADALGSTPSEVEAGLASGRSIAAQAEAAGVDRQAVDEALTGALSERIDAAVEAGKLTEARAAKGREKLDGVVDRILDADGSGTGRGGAARVRDRLKEGRGN